MLQNLTDAECTSSVTSCELHHKECIIQRPRLPTPRRRFKMVFGTLERQFASSHPLFVQLSCKSSPHHVPLRPLPMVSWIVIEVRSEKAVGSPSTGVRLQFAFAGQ